MLVRVYCFLFVIIGEDMERKVLEEFGWFVKLLGKVFDFGGWEGKIDLIEVGKVVGWLSEEVEGGVEGVGYRYWRSEVELMVKELSEYIEWNLV